MTFLAVAMENGIKRAHMRSYNQNGSTILHCCGAEMSISNKGDVMLAHRRISPFTAQAELYCSECSSRRGGIFSDLDHSHLLELEQLKQTSIYPAGALVFMEGEQPRAAYCICSGQVKLSTSSPDGRTVILGIATCGDILGASALLLGRPHDMTAKTIEQTQLCFFRIDNFLAFLERNGVVSLRLAQKLSMELCEACRQVCGAVFKPSTDRLVELLLAFCQTHGESTPEGINLVINLCQDELAELIGVSRRSLNRALAKLRCQGVIECRRRSIIVRDSVALFNCLATQRSS